MERRDFIKTSILGTGILMGSSILYAGNSQAKKVSLDLSYQIHFDSAKEVKIWIPMPIASDFQQPTNIRIQGNYHTYKTYSQDSTPLIYASYYQTPKPKHISISVDVSLTPRNSKNLLASQDLKAYLQPTRYIRTDGVIQDLAKHLKANNDTQTAHNIYAWIYNNLDYENAQNKEGIRKIQSKDGKIAFSGENISANTLFVSLCRACNLPAREAFGLGLQGGKTAFVSKSEVYLKNKGWTPYDTITPIANPTLNGQQKWLGNFVLLNYGRDVQIEKSVLSSFDNAFALVDGDKLSYYEGRHFMKHISYKQLA
ncbi:hypothetical protein BKH46_01855 [Helicobacter sp. 12S02634-8]|uniref:transglutaminase-like domain-containing protein n=1 Tax=Helicobacter sp. 12S02634-8 TaxID=1476199 RepID=UPI000BA5E5C3|nr:transglutaminase domain-containing protein [Helicobacter sp. 12S02634-8]PAF48079.1 hypothetical protein BKH46_01855 [Helicobacter sp. 12S02634-8]